MESVADCRLLEELEPAARSNTSSRPSIEVCMLASDLSRTERSVSCADCINLVAEASVLVRDTIILEPLSAIAFASEVSCSSETDSAGISASSLPTISSELSARRVKSCPSPIRSPEIPS